MAKTRLDTNPVTASNRSVLIAHSKEPLMNFAARRLAAAAAVSGATALALIANPALAGAVVFAGNAEVTADGNVITVQFANVKSDGVLFGCEVWVTDDPATTVIVDQQFVPVVGGSFAPAVGGTATYTTTLPDGDYLVAAHCRDSDTDLTLTPDIPPIASFNLGDGVPVTLVTPPPPGGGFFGSVEMGNLFGSS
jgi:hypothetical protein